MFFKKKYLLAKMMETAGTDPSPDGANAILTRNLKIQFYEGPSTTLDYDRPTLGNYEEIKTAPHAVVSGDVFLSGSGTAGTAPGFSPILRACGLAETVVENTSVDYDPVSDSFESVALYFFADGQLHIILDAKGTFTLNFTKSEIPYISFTCTGLYKTPVAAETVTPAPANFGTPIPFNKANTPVSKIGGASYPMESFTLDMSNQVVHRDLPGSESIKITDRAPSGSTVIEAPAIGTHDFFTDVESHNGATTQAVEIQQGTTAGNICTVSAPKVQLSGLEYQDSDGITAYALSTLFIPDAGDDEISISFT